MVSKRVREGRRLQEIKAIEAETAKIWKKLNRSKPFLVETEKLTRLLENALTRQPEYVRAFFRLFGYPTGRPKAIRTFLSKAPDERTRNVLRTYPGYVARFGVVLKLRYKSPRFRAYPLPLWGSTFHVRIRGGKLLPVLPYPGGDEPYVYFFESNPEGAPAFFQQLIKSGAGKLVEIDDEDGSSILTRLEVFAYAPDVITFVVHQAEQPYLFCLIGGSITNDIWRDAGKVVTAFQKKLAGRGKAGRPPDIKRLKTTHRLLRKKGPKKNVAVDVSLGEDEKHFSSSQSYVSNVVKSLH
jgi:hypothetical protein